MMGLFFIAGFAVVGFTLGFFVLGPIAVASREKQEDDDEAKQ
jgi:hypothetical protein